MPPPGAVCPAIVRYGFLAMISLWVVIVPPTRNTQMRGPCAATQARRLPAPLSLRFVTSMTVPPRPPLLWVPNPSAPGNATTGPPAVDGVAVDTATTVAVAVTIGV